MGRIGSRICRHPTMTIHIFPTCKTLSLPSQHLEDLPVSWSPSVIKCSWEYPTLRWRRKKGLIKVWSLWKASMGESKKQGCWGMECKPWNSSLEGTWGGSRMSNEGCKVKKEMIDFYIYPIWWDISSLKWGIFIFILIPFNYIIGTGPNPREWQFPVQSLSASFSLKNKN